jgi:excisionase family DNA binding protein
MRAIRCWETRAATDNAAASKPEKLAKIWSTKMSEIEIAASRNDPSSPVVHDPYSRYLSPKELGTILGKSQSTLYRLRKRRVLPFIMVGSEIRYRLRDVEKALEKFTVREVSL